MKLHEMHRRWSMVVSWAGVYRGYAVEITEMRRDINSGPVTGHWFSCDNGDRRYNSLRDHPGYKTRDAAEAAVIKYIDDETKKVKK